MIRDSFKLLYANEIKDANFWEVKDSDVSSVLINMEDRMLIKHYCFGVLYTKAGQKKEEEMFGNSCVSAPCVILAHHVSNSHFFTSVCLLLTPFCFRSVPEDDDTSRPYKEFLNFLGDRVKLEGFPGPKCGLDTKSTASFRATT